MQLPSVSSLLLLASLPLTLAGKDHGSHKKGLHYYAKKAGLKYFGSATDSPGQRERAGWEASYPQYDHIMWKSGEFGQTTPTNGQKVRSHQLSTTTTSPPPQGLPEFVRRLLT